MSITHLSVSQSTSPTEVTLNLFPDTNVPPGVIGTFEPKGAIVLFGAANAFKITLSNHIQNTSAEIVDFACSGFFHDENGKLTCPLEVVSVDPNDTSSITLLSRMERNQMIDFGIVVKVGNGYFFFDPQATNDPR